MADTKEFKELFNQSGIPKRLIISFPNLSVTLRNEDIVSESMEISESLCSEPELRFGSCEASVFKLRIIGNVIPLIGERFTVSMYVGDIAEPFALGTYKVASDKPTADRRFRDIVAYDAMHDIINADAATWYNSILPNKDSTTTLRAFRDSFMSDCGMEQEEITLPNDDMVIERTIDPEVISGKDVLSAICEINGCFAHIGRNGKMQYVTLEEIEGGLLPANNLFPMDSVFPYDGNAEKIKEHHYISCKYEDYTTKRIGKLQIRQEENDVGCIIGTGENCYIIEDNFLVYGKSAAGLQAIGQKLFDIISVLWFRPATVQAIGNPCLEVGAKIRLNTQHEVVETYILERTLKGIHGLIDNYEAQGAETYSENVNSVQKSIIQLKGKTNTLERTVEETRSTIEDKEKDLRSEIKQNAENIELRVEKGEVVSAINQSAEEIKIDAGKIALEGVTTINGRFRINEDGTATLSFGEYTAEIGEYGFNVYRNGSGVRCGIRDDGVFLYTSNGTLSPVWYRNGSLGLYCNTVSCDTVNGYDIASISRTANSAETLAESVRNQANSMGSVVASNTNRIAELEARVAALGG